MGRKVIAAAATHEEVNDLLALLRDTDLTSKDRVLLLSPYRLDEDRDLPVEVAYHPVGNTYLGKFISLLNFLICVLKFKPDVILSGFSSVKYRIVSKVFSIVHISYLRGILVNPEVKTGVCDKIKYMRIPFISKLDVFNTYYADVVLATSPITKRFLKKRDVYHGNIYEIGLLSSVKSYGYDGQETIDNERLIFLTQAFETHGLPKLQEEQVGFCRKLVMHKMATKSMIIRAHPRDFYDYESEFSMFGVEINRDNPEQFLRKVSSNDVVVTPFSTYAFELMEHDCACIFYETMSISKVYGEMYHVLGVKVLDDSSIDAVFRDKDVMKEYISRGVNVFYKPGVRPILRGKVADVLQFSEN